MTLKRMTAATLSLVLLALLVWSIFAGVGDPKTWIILALGVVLGALYAALGRIPDWIVDQSGGSMTDDKDPTNISPRVYLPIVAGAILVAVIASWVVLFVM